MKSRPLIKVSISYGNVQRTELYQRRTDRLSHSNPSVATCDLLFNSLSTSSWMVCDSAGAASRLSRSFCEVPQVRLKDPRFQ